ncbi:ATP phosphoribosyltransferase regulatory subunit [Nitrosophilus alvini]|uniref:ATP phosphoribosyltransferase regulatory subunit n=1 Tax=Nitrosophilus alvini TaxID=2714855 RepID=UPI00190BB86D
MVYEHEIPRGARLYFGANAKLKREIEKRASDILYMHGYEEIATPLFSYHQHLSVEDQSELIRVSDEKNRNVTLRADSTIDVVRLITKRLGRSTTHKKWFYIQPVYRYPTSEYYQIGAEFIGSSKTAEVLKTALEIFEKLDIKPLLQLSNIKIPKILSENYGVSLDVLKNVNIEMLLEAPMPWLQKLLYLKRPEQISEISGEVPEEIENELLKIKELADSFAYDNIIVAPLYYAKMRYYDDLFFRFIDKNSTLAMGGEYESENIEAAGFALYTDNLIEILEKKGF